MQKNKIIKKILEYRNSMLVLACLLIIILLSIASPAFYSIINLKAILLNVTSSLLPAVGITLLLISGGFDLSIGSTMAFSSVITAQLVLNNFPVLIAILIGLVSGSIVGLINGIIIGKIGVNPFIATLASMFTIRSLTQTLAGGSNVGGFTEKFTNIYRFTIFNVSISVYFVLFILIVFDFLLKKNKFFKHSYLVGDNEKAAKLLGIKVIKMKLILYTIAGFLAAFAGILITARFNVANPMEGQLLGFTATTAAIIGGASIYGGKGNALGTFLAVILVSLIYDGTVILGIDVEWSNFIVGFLLLIVVALETNTDEKLE